MNIMENTEMERQRIWRKTVKDEKLHLVRLTKERGRYAQSKKEI